MAEPATDGAGDAGRTTWFIEEPATLKGVGGGSACAWSGAALPCDICCRSACNEEAPDEAVCPQN